jgi:hypothetical protein
MTGRVFESKKMEAMLLALCYLRMLAECVVKTADSAISTTGAFSFDSIRVSAAAVIQGMSNRYISSSAKTAPEIPWR